MSKRNARGSPGRTGLEAGKGRRPARFRPLLIALVLLAPVTVTLLLTARGYFDLDLVIIPLQFTACLAALGACLRWRSWRPLPLMLLFLLMSLPLLLEWLAEWGLVDGQPIPEVALLALDHSIAPLALVSILSLWGLFGLPNRADRTRRELRDQSERIEELVARRVSALQKETAKVLQQYLGELEDANEELKNFTYIVSHDLRAPLVNFRGFASELRRSLEALQAEIEPILSELDEKHQPIIHGALREDMPEALGFIDTSVSRMDHLIKCLLKLSRMGRREIRPIEVDMRLLVQETLQSLAFQIEQGGVKVILGELPDVQADPTSLEQILGNIVANAVQYLVPERPGEIEIRGERQADETVFHVRDNGRGIAEEDLPKVFMPFRRAGVQDTAGEGMGLAYVRALVRRHGGRIWCESEPGVGTTFHFTIPRRPFGASPPLPDFSLPE